MQIIEILLMESKMRRVSRHDSKLFDTSKGHVSVMKVETTFSMGCKGKFHVEPWRRKRENCLTFGSDV